MLVNENRIGEPQFFFLFLFDVSMINFKELAMIIEWTIDSNCE